MILPEEGQLLRIFIGESNKYEKQPLYEWIVRKARETGLAGATVFRGLEGYGASSRLHSAKLLSLSADLPIVIEIVDTDDKIEQFIPLIDKATFLFSMIIKAELLFGSGSVGPSAKISA